MFTHKDIQHKTIFIINCIEKRSMRVNNGELLLDEISPSGIQKTLTKMPFQKILALFVIGHITITTPMIDKCKKYGVPLIVLKPNLRPVYFWANLAEANYILHKKQHLFNNEDISIAKNIVTNKIENQKALLHKTKRKDTLTLEAIEICNRVLKQVDSCDSLNALMGMEGIAAKYFFEAYLQDLNWKGRKPRTKCDEINVTLDIGYTLLFNFIECFARMFGFDPYVGVYHRLWFKRKSLICDLIEPFRCIVDHATLIAFKKKKFQKKDFLKIKDEYRLKQDKNMIYYKVFFEALIKRKSEIFSFIQNYYRAFMNQTIECNFKAFKY